jgi:hypothetical protein
LTLVDSSVWIDYFNGTITVQARKMLTSLMVVELGGQKIAIQAAKNFGALRVLGVTVRKTIDTGDFDPFARHLDLRVVD